MAEKISKKEAEKLHNKYMKSHKSRTKLEMITFLELYKCEKYEQEITIIINKKEYNVNGNNNN